MPDHDVIEQVHDAKRRGNGVVGDLEVSAIPSEVTVGASIQVTVVAHDADNGPSPLSATWQTTGGMLGNLSTSGATFTCTAPGTFTVGVRISDGDSGNRCSDTSTITLTCTAGTV